MKHLWKKLRRGERGQTMIFAAVVMSGLMATMGVAVEGGRAFVEYRHLQSAADMAALIGAQKLPCGTSDASCQDLAVQDACNYAQNNGYGGGYASGSTCTASGGATVTVSVPPSSCSPYDFISYGNTGNGSCRTASTPPFYDYIETQISESLGTVPIFNIPVTLSAHAIAKHGVGIPADFALITLSSTHPMKMGGSNTTVIDGSAFANGGIQGNSSETCGGGWYTAGSVSGVTSNDTSSDNYAPPSCGATTDSTTAEEGSLPPVSNPYGSSQAPPSSSSGFPNCTECTANGWWYNGSWHQGGSPSTGNNRAGEWKGRVELFPGIYSSLSLGNSDSAYFNPGVYTFTSGIDTEHGNMCVFGAPTCDSNVCAGNTSSSPYKSFTYNTTLGDQWYYNCSPWGFWDTSTFGGTRPASLPTSAPTWYDSSSGSATTTALNGVTFYFPANAGGIQEQGNGGKNGGEYLAAPNPCPGTGSFSAGSVDFPAGTTLTGSETFDWTGSYANYQGIPSPTPQVYPNMDFSLLGECTNSQTYEVWPGEMARPQHLHFLFWMDPTGNDSKLTGASGQDFYGIFYAPNSEFQTTGAGKSADGPPWITGQVVVSYTDWSGNSTTDISYRSCGAGSTPCGSGDGTQLIQ